MFDTALSTLQLGDAMEFAVTALWLPAGVLLVVGLAVATVAVVRRLQGDRLTGVHQPPERDGSVRWSRRYLGFEGWTTQELLSPVVDLDPTHRYDDEEAEHLPWAG